MGTNMVNRDEPLKGRLTAKARDRRRSTERLAATSAAARAARNDLLPRLVSLRCAPGSLILPARNVRQSDAAHVREVAASISALGFCDPVLIDGDRAVIDGAVRVEAAKLLGLPEIPCIVVTHLTPAERRLLRLAVDRRAIRTPFSG